MPTTVAVDTVPFEQPYINGREVELVTEVLRSGRLSSGGMLGRFERSFAAFVGVEHAVAVASRTAGLQVAASAAGWGWGDEVVTSPFSVTVATQISRATGATLISADVDPRTLGLDPAAVEAAITERTVGIIPAGTFGYPPDLLALNVLAARHGLTIIEDAGEALGSRGRGRGAGAGERWPTVYDCSAGAQVTTGAGAMLCTDDGALADEWRCLVRTTECCLSDVSSAIGVAQLEKLTRVLAMRQQVADEYTRLLGDLQALRTPLADGDGTVRSWFAYWVEVDDAFDRDEVLAQLVDRGIECATHLPQVRDASCPVAERISARSLAIPFFPQLSPQQQRRVVDALRDVLSAV